MLFGVEKLKDALGRGHAGLHLLHHAAELAERLVELAGVLDKCSGSAQSHVAIGHAQAAQDRNGHVGQVGQELHDGHHDAREELCLSCGVVELLVALVEFLRHGLRAAKDDGEVVAGEGFFYLAVELTGGAPLGFELALRAATDDTND